MNASDLCKKAADLVGGERARQHGDKQENHENIAALWTGYLDQSVTALDVALMMVLLKVARTKAGDHNLDDYLDMAGYAGVAAELAVRREADRGRHLRTVGRDDDDPQPDMPVGMYHSR